MVSGSSHEERRALDDWAAAAAAAAAAVRHSGDFVGLTQRQAQVRADQLQLHLRWVDVPQSGGYFLTDDAVAGRITVLARDGVAYEVHADSW